MAKKLYELWVRLAYKDLIQKRKINMVLRPGDRRYPKSKGAIEGEIAKIKIILKPGDEEKGIQPLFDEFETTVRIRKIITGAIGELTNDEWKSCLPDCQDKEMAKYKLALIYNKEFKDDDIVSVLYFDYVT